MSDWRNFRLNEDGTVTCPFCKRVIQPNYQARGNEMLNRWRCTFCEVEAKFERVGQFLLAIPVCRRKPNDKDQGGKMTESVIVREKDKITDRLEGMLADIRYLEHDDPAVAVDTLDRCVAQCAEMLTRIKYLRRWVQKEVKEDTTEEELKHIAWCKEHGVDYNGRYSLTLELTEGIDVPF